MAEKVHEKRRYREDIEPRDFVKFVLKFQRSKNGLLDKLKSFLKKT